ncbi:uncharacterized protein KNAG_0A07410 [Huiozyma naganishii CBS 8797]|uniref:Dilute domain-containing protein n=1 Tax=Huiozyma naganishii (strain ATCC MYA-139 / BCRC 22969 / CBS 8797 / KCTC 17520 / NBRC 10181 / NCYC 3082 / Yp74L-3) TaxID=1071383 RepID=J7S2X5_HUIN7|nr:hypothetical protein KNAG_0A07410 [Kazachstania naganishii CBS 8797]CCK68394.1 hypothetical protein KNAG_0A07410 [Kazachstania naganishii CBS 8797]
MDDNLWGDFAAPTEATDRNGVSTAQDGAREMGSGAANDKVSAIKDTVTRLDHADPKMGSWSELVQLIADETRGEELTTFKDLLQDVSDVNDKLQTGVALIHYIIVFNRAPYIELLALNTRSASPLNFNLVDDVVGYSALMWGVALSRKDCLIELFNFADSINFDSRNKEGINVWDLLLPGTPVYDLLDQNNIFRYRNQKSSFVHDNSTNAETVNEGDDLDDANLQKNIDLQIAGLSLNASYNDHDDDFYNKSNLKVDPLGDNTEQISFNDLGDKFDFNKLQKYQYLEFSDYDIPQILDYLITLPKRYPHMTTYPAALLYQCVRYADNKKKNAKAEVQSLLFLAFTKIASSISTANVTTSTETTNNEGGDNDDDENDNQRRGASSTKDTKPKKSVDIVTQSYWIGALTFIYYYLTKDETFFKRHPNILQELVNTLHSIMVELVTSIHSRLTPLIQKALLNYTTIEDVKETLYKKDWNFFKKRKHAKLVAKQKERRLQKHHELEKSKSDDDADEPDTQSTNTAPKAEEEEQRRNSIDAEILRHLYPPSLEEQMKPSPLKIVQIFGALLYVLNLHQIHPLFQQQCLSIAIKWFSNTVFNQILKDKKKKTLSRARAIQIRLNLSTLESWIKNNDLVVEKPKLIDDFMWERFPFTLVQDLADIDLNNPTLHSVTTYKPVGEVIVITDTSNSLFFYQSFHKIADIHLTPLFQLLQWLQVATTLNSEEALDNTLTLLPNLSPAQILKAIDKYNYEVGEHKFGSKLRQKLSGMAKITSKITYLEERQVPLVALPTVPELTDLFANERDYQPFLPDDIQDFVYELHDANHKMRMNDIMDDHDMVEETELQKELSYGNANDVASGNPSITADNIFNSIDEPTSTVAQPVWGSVAATNNDEFETNPW